MATAEIKQASQIARTVLYGVSWSTYLAIDELLSDNPVRLTYNQGVLEFMTLSLQHEWTTSMLGRMVEDLSLELAIDIHHGGSLTLRREDVKRGLEPDRCYWIEHEAEMRGRVEYDPYSDPPPDLAIEIEVSRSVDSRCPVYAGLKVPEIWRCNEGAVVVLLLGADGEYHEAETCLAFPFLPIAELARFLALRATLSDTEIIRQFRAWVRSQIASGAFPKPPGE